MGKKTSIQSDKRHQHESISDKNSENENEDNQEMQNHSDNRIEGITIFCSICQDYISHSLTTTCEHTFCEICLEEYLIYINECPQCRIKIRHQRFANNILLDNLILEYVKSFQPSDLEQYKKRLQDYKEYKRKRMAGQLETGSLVDIRDLDYVWCKGKVIRTINKYHEKKIKYVMIKYDKGLAKEELPENSSRIAAKGFYTNRNDMPKYERGKLILTNIEEGVSYLISNDSQQEIEEQVQQE